MKSKRHKGSILLCVIFSLSIIAASSLHLWHIVNTQVTISRNFKVYQDKQTSIEHSINLLEQSIYTHAEGLKLIEHDIIAFIPDTLVFGEASGVEVFEFQVDHKQDENFGMTIQERLRMP